MPLAESRGGASGGVWGNAPTVPRQINSKRKVNRRRRQRSVPASNFAHPQMRPQLALPTTRTLSRQMGATDQHRETWFSCCWSFCCMGFASAEATRGLCGRPLDCFASTSKRLDFSCCRDFAPASATRELCGRPLDPFALRQLCYWNLSRQNRPRNPKRAALPAALLETPLLLVRPAPDA